MRSTFWSFVAARVCWQLANVGKPAMVIKTKRFYVFAAVGMRLVSFFSHAGGGFFFTMAWAMLPVCFSRLRIALRWALLSFPQKVVCISCCNSCHSVMVASKWSRDWGGRQNIILSIESNNATSKDLPLVRLKIFTRPRA